jgi:hypothetical protein
LQPEHDDAKTDYLASAMDRIKCEMLAVEATKRDRDGWAAKIKKDIKLVDDRVSKARREHKPPLPRLPRCQWVPIMTARYWHIYAEANTAKDRSD